MEKIVTNNPEKINKQNDEGWSALMFASRYSSTYSNIETVKLLLEKKVILIYKATVVGVL